MFPRVGSQIFTELDSPEDFHVMEVKNVSRDGINVTWIGRRASGISGGGEGLAVTIPSECARPRAQQRGTGLRWRFHGDLFDHYLVISRFKHSEAQFSHLWRSGIAAPEDGRTPLLHGCGLAAARWLVLRAGITSEVASRSVALRLGTAALGSHGRSL